MAGRTSYDPFPSIGTQSLEAPGEAANDIALHRTALADALACAEPSLLRLTRLNEASARVLKVARPTPDQRGVDAVSDGGSWILEVAEDARDYCCNAMARRLYDAVILLSQLHAALASADAANRGKRRFLAMMSHELRSPLNAIIGFSEMIRDEVVGPLGAVRCKEWSAHQYRRGAPTSSISRSSKRIGSNSPRRSSISGNPLPFA